MPRRHKETYKEKHYVAMSYTRCISKVTLQGKQQSVFNNIIPQSYVYWTVHHCNS